MPFKMRVLSNLARSLQNYTRKIILQVSLIKAYLSRRKCTKGLSHLSKPS